MRRRASGSDVGSLDMLLDTMCNTFGCLIFLAILLSVISQQVNEKIQSQTKKGVSAEEADRQKARITELENQILRTKEMRDKIKELAKDGAPFQMPDLSERIKKWRDANTEQKKQIERTDAAVAAAKRDIEGLDKEIADLEAKIKSAKQNAEKTVAEVRKFRVPQLRTITASKIIHMAMEKGRLYRINTNGGNWNFADVEVGQEGAAAVVRMKAGGGTAISPETVMDAVVEPLKLDSQSCMFKFLVGKDSYGEFQLVKRVIVEQGFNYNWVPWDGKPLVAGSRSGTTQQAQ